MIGKSDADRFSDVPRECDTIRASIDIVSEFSRTMHDRVLVCNGNADHVVSPIAVWNAANNIPVDVTSLQGTRTRLIVVSTKSEPCDEELVLGLDLDVVDPLWFREAPYARDLRRPGLGLDPLADDEFLRGNPVVAVQREEAVLASGPHWLRVPNEPKLVHVVAHMRVSDA